MVSYLQKNYFFIALLVPFLVYGSDCKDTSPYLCNQREIVLPRCPNLKTLRDRLIKENEESLKKLFKEESSFEKRSMYEDCSLQVPLQDISVESLKNRKRTISERKTEELGMNVDLSILKLLISGSWITFLCDSCNVKIIGSLGSLRAHLCQTVHAGKGLLVSNCRYKILADNKVRVFLPELKN